MFTIQHVVLCSKHGFQYSQPLTQETSNESNVSEYITIHQLENDDRNSAIHVLILQKFVV